MINNDYIRGYFDAHGYIYPTKRQGSAPRWRIVFQDQDKSQIEKAHAFLTKEGYHPCSYLRKNNGFFGSRTVQKITIERQAEVKRFIEEIGSEKSKSQERFNQFLTGRINKELISVGGQCQGRPGRTDWSRCPSHCSPGHNRASGTPPANQSR